MSNSIVLHGLKKERERLRINQLDLAKKAGVSHMTIRSAEAGLGVYLTTAEKIKAALIYYHKLSEAPPNFDGMSNEGE